MFNIRIPRIDCVPKERLRLDVKPQTRNGVAAIISYQRSTKLNRCLLDLREHLPKLPIIVIAQDQDKKGKKALHDAMDAGNVVAVDFYKKGIGISGARNAAIAIANEMGFPYILHMDDDVRLRQFDGRLEFCPDIWSNIRWMYRLMDENPHVAGIKIPQRNVFFWQVCKVYGLSKSLEVTELLRSKENLLDAWEGFVSRTDLLSNCFIHRMSVYEDIGVFHRNFKPIQDVDWTLRAQIAGYETLANKSLYAEWPVIGGKQSTLGEDGYTHRNMLAFSELYSKYQPLVTCSRASAKTPILSCYPELIKAGVFPKKLKLVGVR